MFEAEPFADAANETNIEEDKYGAMRTRVRGQRSRKAKSQSHMTDQLTGTRVRGQRPLGAKAGAEAQAGRTDRLGYARRGRGGAVVQSNITDGQGGGRGGGGRSRLSRTQIVPTDWCAGDDDDNEAADQSNAPDNNIPIVKLVLDHYNRQSTRYNRTYCT